MAVRSERIPLFGTGAFEVHGTTLVSRGVLLPAGATGVRVEWGVSASAGNSLATVTQATAVGDDVRTWRAVRTASWAPGTGVDMAPQCVGDLMRVAIEVLPPDWCKGFAFLVYEVDESS